MARRTRIAAVLAGALALLGGLPADAGEAPPFPSYSQLCGHRIVETPLRNFAAAYTGPDGKAVIAVDPLLAHPAQASHRTFLIAHECAHIRLGHLDPTALVARRTLVQVTTDQEMSADCWAAETLGRDGLGGVVREIADRFYRMGPVSPGQGYPSGLHRSLIMRHCLEASGTAE